MKTMYIYNNSHFITPNITETNCVLCALQAEGGRNSSQFKNWTCLIVDLLLRYRVIVQHAMCKTWKGRIRKLALSVFSLNYWQIWNVSEITVNVLKFWALWMFPGLFDVSIIKFYEQSHYLNNFLQSLNSELQRPSVTFQVMRFRHRPYLKQLLIVDVLVSICSLKQDYT
jgi:hypothetical protein